MTDRGLDPFGANKGRMLMKFIGGLLLGFVCGCALFIYLNEKAAPDQAKFCVEMADQQLCSHLKTIGQYGACDSKWMAEYAQSAGCNRTRKAR